MFSALFKAFTGRAGLLASLLVLILVGLTAAAVYIKLPIIEQRLAGPSSSVAQEPLAEHVSVAEESPAGEQVQLAEHAEGDTPVEQAEVPASAELPVSAPAPGEADVDGAQNSQPAELAEVVVSPVEAPAPAGEAIAEVAEKEVDGESAFVEAPVLIEESSLALRYDGKRLSLSGHMGDEQMAQLVVDTVRRALPPYSEMTANVDGTGKASPLNWMGDFLAAVSYLPDDAQGLIAGSDSKGVEIVPDAQQGLRGSADRERLEVLPADTEGAMPETSEGSEDTDAGVTGGQPPAINAQPQAEQNQEVAQPEAAAAQPDELSESAGSVAVEVDVQNMESNPAIESIEQTGGGSAQMRDPGQYIVALNQRVLDQAVFAVGEYEISETLTAELDGLAEMLRQNPSLLLRVVGNIDFAADPQVAEFIGIDRAREVRDYLYGQGIEPTRVFATPLPRKYAFDKRVQLVFYISE